MVKSFPSIIKNLYKKTRISKKIKNLYLYIIIPKIIYVII